MVPLKAFSFFFLFPLADMCTRSSLSALSNDGKSCVQGMGTVESLKSNMAASTNQPMVLFFPLEHCNVNTLSSFNTVKQKRLSCFLPEEL